MRLLGDLVKHKPLPEVSITELWEHFGGTVVGRDSTLWRKATCVLPEHDDKSPSASINEDAGKWGCFVCDAHGDAFDLIQRMEPGELGFAAAVSFAEKFSGGSNRPVREQRGGSSLLPRGKRHQSGSGAFVPTWRRFGTGGGA